MALTLGAACCCARSACATFVFVAGCATACRADDLHAKRFVLTDVLAHAWALVKIIWHCHVLALPFYCIAMC